MTTYGYFNAKGDLLWISEGQTDQEAAHSLWESTQSLSFAGMDKIITHKAPALEFYQNGMPSKYGPLEKV